MTCKRQWELMASIVDWARSVHGELKETGQRMLTTHVKWRRLHRPQGTRAPTFTNGLARTAPSVEQQTMSWPKCTDHHGSAHQSVIVEWRGATKICSRTLRWTCAPHPLSNSFPRQCTFWYIHMQTVVWLRVKHWAYWRPQLVVAEQHLDSQ